MNIQTRTIIINQIALGNKGTTVHQSTLSDFTQAAELYERIIAQQAVRLKEKDALIETLKHQLNAVKVPVKVRQNCVK